MNRVTESYELCMREIGDKMRSFPWESKSAYADWLAQTYYFASITTRLLALASARMPMTSDSLHLRFIDHTIEERGHEKMLVNDLDFIGEDIKKYSELYSTAGLYQTQFYYIEHSDPLAFFGYIVMLEGVGALHCKDAYQKVIDAHGLNAGIFLKIHSEEDTDHIEKAMKMIEGFSDKTNEMIVKNMEHSAKFYLELLAEIVNRNSNLNQDKVA